MTSGAADLASAGIPGLQCNDVWLRYSPGLPPVLRGVSLEVAPGEIVALVGHNGAGKSTLVKALTGVVHPERGTISLDGQLINGWPLRHVMAAGVSCVWQELSVIPTMSVLDNLLLGMPDRARLIASPARARRRVHDVARRCDLDNIDLNAKVGGLAFVDRQRVEIARAMALEARYLLLDEPTAGQRGRGREELFALIRSTAQHGVGVLLVDHHLDEVVELARRALVLRDGVLVGEAAGASLNVERMTVLMTGHEVAEQLPSRGYSVREGLPAQISTSSQNGSGKCRLRCTDLSAENVAATSLALYGGTVYGFYGLEGAGQSELLSVLAGAAAPTGGSMEVDGRAVRFRAPADAARAGIVYLSGDRAQMLVKTMTGSDNLLLVQMASKPLWSIAPTRKQRQQAARELVAQLDVKGDWHGLATGLSGGNQQKLVIGRALQRPPAIALMEGPTLGVDVAARAQIVSMIRELAASNSSAVCLASTDEDEVLDACDQIFVMVGGHVAGHLDVTPDLGKEQLRAAAVATGSPATIRAGERRDGRG